MPSLKNNQINLNCYLIRYTKRSKSGFLKMSEVFKHDSFADEMTDLWNFFSSFSYTTDDETRVIEFTEKLTLSNTIFSGVLKKGHNGQETDIDIITDGKLETLGKVNRDQYNSIHFYFLICLPNKKSDYLILMTQSFGLFGFKELFYECLRKYTVHNYANQYTLYIDTLTIPSLFQDYIRNGIVKTIKLKKHGINTNIENFIDEKDSKNDNDYEAQLTLVAKDKKGFQSLKNVDFTKSKFVELFDLGFDFDTAFADISLNGRPRSINILEPDKFTASFNITSRIQYQPDTNRPYYPSVDKEAVDILKNELLSFL